jgi:thymidylate synthase ThyX
MLRACDRDEKAPVDSTRRAEQLYDRIFTQYGDDSVAQLGGAHIACEDVSNILTKVLERGRLAAYLEQSTRYIRYDQKVNGGYRYAVPPEIRESQLCDEYIAVMELLFDTYAALLADLVPRLEERFPRSPSDSAGVWRATINAKACDIARGLLPASTLANMGIFATGQALEMLLIRMFANPLEEVRAYAEMILAELRAVMPAFVRRVDDETRGRAWTRYLTALRQSTAKAADEVDDVVQQNSDVRLVDWERFDAEEKVIAAALYECTDASQASLDAYVCRLTDAEKDRVFAEVVGERLNRRHKPGRGFERVSYKFDIVCDYGGFRDLQRHRMLTAQWQRLSTLHGYETPEELNDLPVHRRAWHAAMEEAKALYARCCATLGRDVAQYCVPLAFRVRFTLQMNAREAFHLLELRSQRQGHPAYRRICQEMHRLIADVAGHRRIAHAMQYVDHATYDLERLEAERSAERRASKAAALQTS